MNIFSRTQHLTIAQLSIQEILQNIEDILKNRNKNKIMEKEKTELENFYTQLEDAIGTHFLNKKNILDRDVTLSLSN